MRKRAALYARVSTDQQVDRDSIPAQVDALKKYAEKHDYEVQDIYIDDGISGTLFDERDELQRLLENVKKRKIDIILICKLDRWFRSVKHYMNTQEILDEYEVPWVTIWENFGTDSPSSRLMTTQMLAFAEFEADNTAVRINKVFDYKKTQHEVLSGKMPAGYKIVDKHYAIDEEKAESVRRAFATYMDTGSICETLRRLDGTGLPRTQRGLKYLLQNRRYLGEAHGYDDYLPQLIDDDTFATVQRMLSMNVKRGKVRTYIFTGLMYCSDCGRRLTGTSDHYKNTRYKTYRCMYHYRTLPSCKNSKSLNEHKLEMYLVENLKSLAFESLNAEDDSKADDCRNQIKALEKKLSRLKDLYVNELIGIDEYRADMTAYKDSIATLNKRLREYEGDDKNALKSLVGTNLADWYWTLSEDERRKLWRGVIKKIWYGTDHTIRVEFL